MPLFLGATSKIILAHLPARALKSMFEKHAAEIAKARLGADLDAFRASLAAIRRAGFVVTHGEIDPGRVGIGAPLFDRDHNILGSLSFALPDHRADDALLGRLAPLLVSGAREIERLMNEEPASQVSAARLRVSR